MKYELTEYEALLVSLTLHRRAMEVRRTAPTIALEMEMIARKIKDQGKRAAASD